MKICVLNGSPKGRQSITMQYVRFLELAFPAHTFVTEDIGLRIAAIEKDEKEFAKIIASVSSADAVLFATPVYYLLVPAQLKRFIELVFTRNAASAFSGKYAASLTTSIHFFDHTANAYLHAISEDLGMNWAGAFMAKSEDLLFEKHQRNLVLFGQDFFDTAARRPEIQKTYPPADHESPEYRPGPVPLPFDAGTKNVLILSDATPGSNLEKMVGRAASCFGKAASIVPLEEAGIKGGCLGCCRCAFDNTCIYTDGFREFFEETIQPADIIIYAGPIRDRYLSAAFKQFFDRSFYRGHVPYLEGKQVAFLIQGPLSRCSTLREVLTAFVTVQGANPAGMVSDESPVSGLTDARIDALCGHALRLAESGYIAPAGFPRTGGLKVLRDEIWGNMRAMFKADHAYYKAHGMYDFPQNDPVSRIRTSLFSLLLALPPVRREAEQHTKEHMIEPFARVFTDSPVLRERLKKP
ncbi:MULTISPECIES: NAD(P)H-dependent oxidoreductase [unclassified Methanoregula]|uniref:NAD(P)H-dependent oxidoreductase n=1 Tax=unclassified Methanoregula TaxID=2649730 RepID=UPI0009CB5C56|nr:MULTISPECIES: NAD(P)H-dependent oxidoreductase [unclassified Methanoregula]OPX64425.1 MAG: FMN-dependent NADH-azoreductase [Methanoregula sp. PtaB.Bin085]OPY34905.1 MAG: FMN-dependent NADH-azoreductase [Methanoregula sp. PtaU1.Bin006]